MQTHSGSPRSPAYWAIVPAAGRGQRMGSETPKQYLDLGGRMVLEHTLDTLLSHPRIGAVVLVLATDDAHWPVLQDRYQGKNLFRAQGGRERCDSVLNGLASLPGESSPDDWILVHDAARPCLRQEDIDRLLDQLAHDPVGGLLAVPVRDTMKRADPDRGVRETVNREGLWHALTPQMFRLDILRTAMQAGCERKEPVTDEASAVEHAGYRPRLVEGHGDNIKITYPDDLALAEYILRRQGRLD